MEEPLKAKQKEQFSQNILTTKTEPTPWEELQQMPYDESLTGQGFVIGLSLPKNETKPSKTGSK